MKNWYEFLEDIKKLGFELDEEDNHILAFRHIKTGERIVFNSRMATQEKIIGTLKNWKDWNKNGRN